jgi:hypothetical protein
VGRSQRAVDSGQWAVGRQEESRSRSKTKIGKRIRSKIRSKMRTALLLLF